MYVFGLGLVVSPGLSAAIVVAPNEDVMTSAFFQGADLVRGYDGDNRPTFRVSSTNAFDAGPETIYLDFSNFNPSEIESAQLTMQSVSGGFGADAGSENPFLVSAHGVATNPFNIIIDDTNPGGTMSWDSFYSNQILPADAAAITSVEGFGAVTFDVTALVQIWEANPSAPRVIAMTAKNDIQEGNGFLHGFSNNSAAPGSSFLTVNAVPEPAVGHLSGLAILAAMGWRRRLC
jgi:hypothetical protein